MLTLLAPLAPHAQSVTVETVVDAGSQIDDGLAIGPDGALYGSRFGGFPAPVGTTVTRVDPATGATSVHASGFQRANGLAFGPDGSLYVANYNTGAITRVTPDGTQSTLAQANTTVSGLAYDSQNDRLYVASYDGGWVRYVSSTGTLIPVVSGLDSPAGLAFDDQNRLHVANFENGTIYRISGTTATLFADVRTAVGFLAFGGGQFYATGIRSHRLYTISASGDVTRLAGTGAIGTVDGPGGSARFNRPNGIVATANGDTLYVSDAGSRAVRRIILAAPTAADETPEALGTDVRVSPNPATGEARMEYRLGAPAEVDVALYDSLGRRIRTVVQGLQSSGTHQVGIDVSDLASGVYVVSVAVEGRLESRRLVVP
ncbi:MAG: SMP-30/gluconolactonase/LRE family protein [Bacteroidota bacterium]